ncbi:helix-turn-helix transcriptional regulator [Actinoplanes sp. NPDC020271]|uniref:helix-turn-helix transcriptional regulator n=1 Tax=Actinoplanes sp. NPDC020271 TaxID=3363896 RepID=UPI0037AFEEDE
MASRRSRLVRRREEVGLSQEGLATLIMSDRTTIGRIERGETSPQPQTRDRLGKALQVTPELLTDLLIPDGDETPIAAPATAAPAAFGADSYTTGVFAMYRRELLRLLGLAGTLICLAPIADTDDLASAPESDDRHAGRRSGDLKELRDFNTHLWQVFGLSATKRLVYPLAQDQLHVLIDRLDNAKSEFEHRQVCILVSELFQLAGEIFFDSDLYADATHCYNLAASAAKEASAYDHWACALTRHGYVSLYDRQYDQAAKVLDAAGRVAARGDSQLATRYWVASAQAQAAAALHDVDGFNRAWSLAEQITGSSDLINPGGWLRFDGSRLDEERGACHLTLGQSELAADALAAALKRSVSPRRRSSLLVDLGVVGVRRRDADEVLLHGHAAVTIAEQSRSPGYLGRRLQSLQTQLHPLTGDPRIVALDDRITGVLARA